MKPERIVENLLEGEAEDYMRDFTHTVEKETVCCGAAYQVSKSARGGTRIFCRKCGQQTSIQKKMQRPVPESLDQKLGALQGQAKEAGDLLDRTGTALERTHPKAQHPELHQRLGDLQQKRREADDLLGKARYAAAYRKALHKVGLKPTDVVTRFGGEARQFALSNLRRGKYINAVQTKDGRRVKLDPPVEVPPQTDVRGHGDNPLWMARLRIGQPPVTAEQAKEQRERLEQQVNAQQVQARQQPVKPVKPVVEAADPDNPDSLMKHYAPAISGKNAEVLKTFKRQVIGYIKWTHAADIDNGIPTGYEPEDLVRVRKAKTFEEVEAILAQFEGEPSFLYMIRAGYF